MVEPPDTFITDVEGKPVRIHISSNKASNHIGDFNRGDWGFQVFNRASEQSAIAPESFLFDFQGNSCEPPPYSLEVLSEMYEKGGVHHACVEAKVSDVVGQGYTIRPRSELFPRAGDGEPELDPRKEDQKRIYDFLDIPTEEDGTTFLQILEDMYRDKEAIGQGYIEFSRNKIGGKVSGMYYAPSVSIRIAKGGVKNGFFQRAHGRYKYFARYDGVQKAKFVSLDGVPVQSPVQGGKVYKGTIGINPEVIGNPSLSLYKKSTPRDLNALNEGAANVIRANELIMFRHGTTKLTSYGQPDILAARDDFSVEQAVSKYGLAYFDNATIPRIIMSVSGDSYLTKEVIDTIKNFLSNKEPIEVLQQSMIVELPDGVTMQIDPLTQAHLSDSTGLMELRNHSALYQAAAHRVPLSAIPMQTGSNRAEVIEDNARYVGSVVRPEQRKLEARLNWVFKNETGVETWVIDLDVPDLTDMETKHKIWEIGARRGWYSINEIRGMMNMRPIKGGDVPFVSVPGQGNTPISHLEEIANRMLEGAKRGDLMVTGNRKTPPKGDTPIPASETPLAGMANGEKAVAFVLPHPGEFPEMSDEEWGAVAAFTEELVINSDDVEKVRGKSEDTP